MKERNTFRNATIAIISFWLILFAFVPNFLVFAISFLKRDEHNLIDFSFSFNSYLRILDPVYLKVFISSFQMALITTVICIVVAFPFAYILSKVKKEKKSILLLLVIIPFWTSALIRTYAIKILLTTNGLINTVLLKFSIIEQPLKMLYTDGAVILGLVYTLLPFMILPLYATMEKLDYRYIEAAQDLGANKFQTFYKVIIPLTSPGIIAGALLVFLPALGLFYIPDILGGSKSLLIGNLIKNQFLSARDWPFGSAISVSLTLIMAILLYAYYRTSKALNQKIAG